MPRFIFIRATEVNPVSNIYVHKGQVVSYSVHTLHRSRDLWGEDAEEFKSERWEKRKAGWDWLPFNGGPRICLGQQFALIEAGYILVRLLQRFDAFEDVSGEEEERGCLPLELCRLMVWW
jgi:cytochrome P450